MKKFIVLDLETNGVDPEKDDIIEVGIALVEDFKVTREYQAFVKPLHEIPFFVQKLTGIKNEDVAGAKTFDEIKQEIADMIADLPIVGHNIDFDVSFLKKQGLAKTNPRLDTWELATTLLPHLRYFSLEYLSWYYDFQNQPSHRALKDVLANADLMTLLASEIANLPETLRAEMISILSKTNWDWGPLFEQELPKLVFKPRADLRSLPPKANGEISSITSDLIGQINFINYPTTYPAGEAAFELAEALKPSLLIVHPPELRSFEVRAGVEEVEVLGKLNFNEDNFRHLIALTTLDIAEARLCIKLLLWMAEGHDPATKLPYLTRDEVYLWQRRIADFSSRTQAADKQLTTFNYWWEEVAAPDPEKTLIVTSPDKFIFEILETQGFRL